MFSNRLTFPLTSLIVLFALAFTATAVMAAPGGPTVTITKASGPQTRAAFKMDITFSAPVQTTDLSDDTSADFAYSLKDSAGDFITGAINLSTFTVAAATPAATTNTQFTITVDVSSESTARTIVTLVPADAANAVGGLGLFDLGNQASTLTEFTLPPIIPESEATAKFTKVEAVANTPGAYDLEISFVDSTDTLLTTTLSTTMTVNNLQTTPENGVIFSNFSDAQDPLYTVRANLRLGTTRAVVRVNPGFAAAHTVDGTVTLPPPPPVDPPMVRITVSDYDAAQREFRVTVNLTPATGAPDVTNFAITDLKITDSIGFPLNPTTANGLLLNERPGTNIYQALIRYTSLDVLPLTITLRDDYQVTGDRPSAMVPPPRTDLPLPSSVTATALANGSVDVEWVWTGTQAQQDALDEFEVTWTSASITSNNTTTVAATQKTYNIPAERLRAGEATTVSVKPLAKANSEFTTPSTGTSSVVTPQEPPPPQTPPLSFGSNRIANQTFRVGTPVFLNLPRATGGTQPYSYTFFPIPAGLHFNASTRVLSGIPTIALSETPGTYTVTDATGTTASLHFLITVTGSSPPPTSITFTPGSISNQTFTVNTPISPLPLPQAVGGTPPYTYTLSPVPTGLFFIASARSLTGTPTVIGTTQVTYSARDRVGASGSLSFSISVISSSVPPPVPPPPGPPGDIQDAGLAGAIRRSLGLDASTSITPAHLQRLITLDAYSQNISNLAGLQQASNLRVLDLGRNQLTDISVLGSLTQLTRLYLDDNQITNVSPLAGLRSLRLLRLAGNTILNTAPLVTLVQQNPGLDLDIPLTLPPDPGDNTQVTFADPKLATAVKDALGLSANDVITKGIMRELLELEAYDRRINSISGLEHATKLMALDLGKNNISDISPLQGLTQLQVLFLDDNQIVDVSPLAGLTQLELLFLQGNPISSLAPISHLIDDIRIIRTRHEE